MRDIPCPAGPVPHLAVLVRKFIQSEFLEQNSSKMSRHKSWEALELRTDTKNQKEQKMVAGCEKNQRLRRKVAEIYRWIDKQLCSQSNLAGQCDACGRCCDFDAYDHRLYVTPPELEYLVASLDVEKFLSMPTSRCPYNIDGKCSVYEYRFAGCRIFFCKADADFQSRFNESAF